jgi:type IV pilus biogenesis protein CpaD/CtpE
MARFEIGPQIDRDTLGGDIEDVKRIPAIIMVPEGDKLDLILGTEKRLITTTQAKAIAKFLNSWAGFEESALRNNSINGPSVNGHVSEAQIKHIVEEWMIEHAKRM